MLHASLALVAVAMRVVMALVDLETMVRADAAVLTVVASVIGSTASIEQEAALSDEWTVPVAMALELPKSASIAVRK